MTDEKALMEGIQDLRAGWLADKPLEVPTMPISDFTRVAAKAGLRMGELTGDETMGWEVDFWYPYLDDAGNRYTLSGSLHNGEYKLTRDKPKTEA